MSNFSDKNILICCNLKKERIALFNFFDGNDAEMIHTAIDLDGCADILNDPEENIHVLVIECAKEILRTPKQLFDLTHNHSNLKTVLLINNKVSLSDTIKLQFQQIVNLILFEGITDTDLKQALSKLYDTQQSKATTIEKTSTKSNAPTPQGQVEKDTTLSLDATALWDVFFYDSAQAKLIINAKTQKISHLNNALVNLLQQNQQQLIGLPWYQLDANNNHANYNNYIKEITTNEKTSFIINNTANNTQQNLLAEYQMSVIDNEIIYLGVLSKESVDGVSSDVYSCLGKIFQTSVGDSQFNNILEDVRKYLGFDFLVFYECSKNQFEKSTIVGNDALAQDVIGNSFLEIQSILKDTDYLELDLNNKASVHVNILDKNNLQCLCFYPIEHNNKYYGALLAGSKKPVKSWKTISILFKSLVNRCRFCLFQKSIIDEKEADGQMDNLTSLPNRNALTEKIDYLLQHELELNKYIALLIIDVKKLNYLNKSLGIELTDELILNLSVVIKKSIANTGAVYRLSGHEFVILLHPQFEKFLAETKAQELIEKMNRPILISNGEEVEVDYNIGVSIYPDDGQTVSSLLKNADLALYDAKLAGRNNFVTFKLNHTGRALTQKIELEENLKNAIKEGFIKVFFQPKINAQTEDIIGFEALVRWIDPVVGMVNPGQFIPIAEETGLICDIGEIVAARSCEMLLKWQDKYRLPLTCSVNLSAIQLIDTKLPSTLEKIINQSGIHPKYIDFEITETISLDVVPNLMDTLNEIVEIGCTLSIDDFGTGHSTLDYVKKIPAKYIKIDQSFVKNIGINPEDEAILDATINIAKRLKRRIIAEGVETEEQREYLLNRECEFFQGFLFSKPLSEDEVEELLAERVALMGKLLKS